jgi:hypothetical protein
MQAFLRFWGFSQGRPPFAFSVRPLILIRLGAPVRPLLMCYSMGFRVSENEIDADFVPGHCLSSPVNIPSTTVEGQTTMRQTDAIPHRRQKRIFGRWMPQRPGFLQRGGFSRCIDKARLLVSVAAGNHFRPEGSE